MNTNIRAQIAAISGILLLASITVAPWMVESHWLKPQEVKWHAIIKHKNELVATMLALDKAAMAYQNMPEKKEANQSFQHNRESTSLDNIQSYVGSNPKYMVSNFKTSLAQDSKSGKISFTASFNDLGRLFTDVWNNYQFLALNSMIMKPNPNRSEEEIMVSASVALP
jgi:hypothetical protein